MNPKGFTEFSLAVLRDGCISIGVTLIQNPTSKGPEYTGSKKRLLFKSGMWSKLNYDDRINIKDYYMRGDRIKLTYDASSC